jgi:ferredoxin
MANKKPAKPIAGQSRTATVLDPAIYGSLIKIYGSKDARCQCGSCAREIVKGMVREKGGAFYCSTVCAKNSN